MRLRPLGFSCLIVLGGSVSGLAQQPTGPATLESLLVGEGASPAQRPAAVDATVPAATNPPHDGRIQGAVTRPKDGVRHPDLDAAWAEYDKQVEAVTAAIERAIVKELNAAAAAGDLDGSLKWKTAGEQFKKDGRIPEGCDGGKAEGRPKPKAQKLEASPYSQIADAQKQLAAAYRAVEKGLVQSHDLEMAQKIRAERTTLLVEIAPPRAEGEKSESFVGRWAAGPNDPYLRVVEPQGRVREFDRRTGKETAAGALRRLDDGRYEAVMSNGFTVYWRLLASDRAEFHAMNRAGKMQDKVVLKKQ